jgi:putative ABC transport system permease protein
MLAADIRHAIRGLARDPGVAAVVVLCLALGIGINATLFSVVDGVLIQSLPFADPDRLVVVNETSERRGVREAGVSYLDLKDWREQTTTLTTIAGVSGRTLTLSDGKEAERYEGGSITWDLFPLLGVPPALGRPFGPADDVPGAEPVVIISDDVWRQRYHADLSIVGRSVLVNARPHTVVAVMPPKFAFPENSRLWVPHGPIGGTQSRISRSLFTFARLKPGVDLAAARADLAGMAARTAAAYPQTSDGWSAMARPMSDEMIPDDVRLILSTMMGAVTLVLLVACANVANLMLARASGRQREFAVRASLGAGRARLVRQLLTESVLLGLIAAPLGLAVARFGVYLLDAAVPPDAIPYYVHWEISGRGVAYTAIVSALTGIVFGLAPALQAGRLNLQETLRDGARGSGGSGRRARLRNALVVVEVALTLVLLVGASLFVRSFFNMQGAKPGFDTAPLLTLRFFMTGDAYPNGDALHRRVEDVMRRVDALPGVEAAFASNFIPLGGGGGGGTIVLDGKPPLNDDDQRFFSFVAATPHLFQTLGLPLQQGRHLTDGEAAGKTPLAVINETMAKRFWPGEDAVGRRFRRTEDNPPQWFTVIGVAPDIRQFELDDDTPPFAAAYVPYWWNPTFNTGLTIRTASDPAALTSAVRSEIRASDPGLAIFDVMTMEERRTRGFWQFKLFGQMFGIFGAAALFMAAIGVYGVLAFSVAQRTQELGVRIALGAQRRDVLHMVVRQGLNLAAVGVAVGLVGAGLVTPVVRSQLMNVSPFDPVSFGGVAVFLMAVALTAAYVPARRATTVDPIIALRNE